MPAKKSTRTPKARKPRPVKPAAVRANDKARNVSEAVAKLTPAERKKLIASNEKLLAKYAPTAAAAKSDLLLLLNAVAAAFVGRYYPDATNASIHISKYTDRPTPPEFHVHLPLAVAGGAL